MAAASGLRLWFRLEGAASAPTSVVVPSGADVADLRDKIKEKLADDARGVPAYKVVLSTADGKTYDDPRALVSTLPLDKEFIVTVPRAAALPNVPPAFADITARCPDLTGPALALEAGAVVRLPAGVAGAGKTVIVREVYLQIRERLLAMPPGLAGVYGTPGVGKSIFASLLLLSLAGADGSVFYAAFGTPSAVQGWCLREGRVFEVPRGELASALAQADGGDKPAWLVVDGHKCDNFVITPTRSLRIVVVSSANLVNRKWLREVDKLISRTYCLLMPPFSCAELASLPGARDDVGVRFAQFGGSACLVLADLPHENWAQLHVRGLGPDVLRRVMRDVEEGSLTEHASGRVLHLFPGRPRAQEPRPVLEYERRVIGYASPAVSDALVARYWAEAKPEVVAKLEAADLFADHFGVSLLFEPVMHYRLLHGLAFDSEQGESAFRLPPLQLQVLEELYGAAGQCPEGIYLRPASKNYAAIDAVARVDQQQLYLFQMTGQQDHHISMNGMLRVFDVPPGTRGAVKYTALTKKRSRQRGAAEEKVQERADGLRPSACRSSTAAAIAFWCGTT